MSLYYDESLLAHEHHPAVPDHYKYLQNERQWLLIKSSNSKIAFLRFVIPLYCLKQFLSIPLAAIWPVPQTDQTTIASGIPTCTR